MMTEIIFPAIVVVLIVAVVIYFTTQKKVENKKSDYTSPAYQEYADASHLVRISVLPTGNYTGGKGSPSYMLKPVMAATLEQIADVDAPVEIEVSISYSYISGYNNGEPIFDKGGCLKKITLDNSITGHVLMCEPSLKINVISVKMKK